MEKNKLVLRIFSFLSAFMIMFCLGTVTAFAAGQEDPKKEDGDRYYQITDNPQDGEDKWPWPVDGLYNSLREALYNVNMNSLDNGFALIDNATDWAKDTTKKHLRNTKQRFLRRWILLPKK